ncbi:MAG: type II toxin-antitoxin system HicA family toxin [Euryarchaeota archaeon]|nr:type II toxin-antitoxin system HicA family toxin [Euryarchaeota archaeon]
MKFPKDVPISKVLKIFESLRFETIRTGNHISMQRINPDGTKTPLTLPNHSRIKGSTLRTIYSQAGISRDDFLKFYK